MSHFRSVIELRDLFVQFGAAVSEIAGAPPKDQILAELRQEVAVLPPESLRGIVEQIEEYESIGSDATMLQMSISDRRQARDDGVFDPSDTEERLSDDIYDLHDLHVKVVVALDKLEELFLPLILPVEGITKWNFVIGIEARRHYAESVVEADREAQALEDADANVEDEDMDHPPEEALLTSKVQKIQGSYPQEVINRASAFYHATLVSAEPSRPSQLPGDLDPEWEGLGPIAGGGFGKIKVFGRFNTDGYLIERKVQKDTSFSTEHEFDLYYKWYGPTADRMPMEYWTQEQVCFKTKYILDLDVTGPLVDVDNRMYRVYLAYAPQGDLHDANFLYSDAYEWGEAPKGFVLYLFKALVEAALVLQQGSTNEPVAGWREIVHRDLKPENIFLDNPDPESFPNYPQPKMADFGLAFVTSQEDPSNPALWYGAGTEGYMSPELIPFIDARTGQPVDDFKILSPCNVWGIGAILHAFMRTTCHDGDDQPTYLPGEAQRSRYRLRTVDWPQYGRPLCELVNDCLEDKPEERPLLQDIAKSTGDMIAKDEEIARAESGQQDPEDMVKTKAGGYQLGMSRVDLLGDTLPRADITPSKEVTAAGGAEARKVKRPKRPTAPTIRKFERGPVRQLVAKAEAQARRDGSERAGAGAGTGAGAERK